MKRVNKTQVLFNFEKKKKKVNQNINSLPYKIISVTYHKGARFYQCPKQLFKMLSKQSVKLGLSNQGVISISLLLGNSYLATGAVLSSGKKNKNKQWLFLLYF